MLLTREEEKRLSPSDKIAYAELLALKAKKVETAEEWLSRRFPNETFAPMAKHHQDYWQWIRNLHHRQPPDSSHVACWSRGGGKSTTVQYGTAYVCDTQRRDYCLIVCGEQGRADETIVNIAGRLEAMGIRPALNRVRQQKGWTHQLLRAEGFTAAAYGLDTTIRGSLVDYIRPDWIHLDDIHSLKDSLQVLEKKRDIITKSVLPALATYGAVSFTQNAVDRESEMSRMIDGRADYLLDRNRVVPIPALYDPIYNEREVEGVKRWFILSGTPSWVGQGLTECQNLLNKIGIQSFRTECQHEVYTNIPNQRFNNEKLTEALQEIRNGYHNPLSRTELYRTLSDYPELIELTTDETLLLWETPKDDGNYLISLDCAEGLTRDGQGDFYALHVLDADTWTQVGRLHGVWEPYEMAQLVNSLALLFGGKRKVLIGVLRKGGGEAVLSHLIHNHQWPLQYGREWHGLYCYEEKEVLNRTKPQSSDGRKPGFPENVATKPVMISALADAIEQEALLLHDEKTVMELLTYVKLPGGKTGGSTGTNDDLVSSLALGTLLLAIRYDRAVRAREEREEREEAETDEGYGSKGWGRSRKNLSAF